MLLLLATVVLSILYAFRIPRLRRVRADNFPNVDPQIVLQWRMLELRSIYALLLTTAGLLVIGAGIVAFALQTQLDLEDKNLKIVLAQGDRLLMVLALIGLAAAGNYGVQAGKLRKSYALHSANKK